MTNTNDAVLWLSGSSKSELVDARGWSDTMLEVAVQVPELAKDVREQELGALLPNPVTRVD